MSSHLCGELKGTSSIHHLHFLVDFCPVFSLVGHNFATGHGSDIFSNENGTGRTRWNRTHTQMRNGSLDSVLPLISLDWSYVFKSRLLLPHSVASISTTALQAREEEVLT